MTVRLFITYLVLLFQYNICFFFQSKPNIMFNAILGTYHESTYWWCSLYCSMHLCVFWWVFQDEPSSIVYSFIRTCAGMANIPVTICSFCFSKTKSVCGGRVAKYSSSVTRVPSSATKRLHSELLTLNWKCEKGGNYVKGNEYGSGLCPWPTFNNSRINTQLWLKLPIELQQVHTEAFREYLRSSNLQLNNTYA